jgi:tetratricopeptide (TPR) repeat protein
MYKLLFIIALSLFSSGLPCQLFCQADYHKEVKDLMTDSTINLAETKVNESLAKYPDDVELLVMKGNIFYLKFSYSQAEVMVAANPDESVYNSSIGFVSEPQVIIPLDVADSVIKYLQMGIKIDKTREDIYLGICHVLSQSLQTDKVIEYLPIVKANVKLGENAPYTLSDYARNIKARDKFDDAMRVYWKISEMYPESTGIINDIAVEYYLNGDLAKADESFRKIIDSKNLDELTLSSAFSFYSTLEDNKLALDILKRRSALLNDGDYLLFEALLELNQGKDWKKPANEFLKTHSEGARGVKLAEILADNNFSATRETLLKCLEDNLTDSYKIQIYLYFKTVANDPLAAYYYAEALAYSHRYSDAVKAFEEIDISKMNSKESEDYLFYFAWAAYKSGNYEKSVKYWEKLIDSEEFYYQSAAAYFIGKFYLDKGDKKKAMGYFAKVSEKATESKYATYCWNLLKEL